MLGSEESVLRRRNNGAKALNIVKIGHNRQYPENYCEVPQDVGVGTPGMC